MTKPNPNTDYATWLQEYADSFGDLSNTLIIEDWQREEQVIIREAATEIRRLRAMVERYVTEAEKYARLLHREIQDNDRYRDALDEIRECRLPDQPAAVNIPDYDWAVRHISTLRLIAKRALEPVPEAVS